MEKFVKRVERKGYKMNICIAGSRNITEKSIISNAIFTGIDNITTYKDKDNLVFVLGGAKGVDSIAEEVVKSFNYSIIKILPDWNKYGKRAGYLRNAEMIKISDGLIAIWDGISKGTKHTIDLAREKQIPIFVANIKDLK